MSAQDAVGQLVHSARELIVERARADGLRYERAAAYPSEAGLDRLPLDAGECVYQSVTEDELEVVLQVGEAALGEESLLAMSVRNGFFRAHAYASSDAAAQALIALACGRVPRSELDPDEISVTFWTLGPTGPVATSRKVKCPQWADIEGNYAAATRSALEELMAAELDPMQGGKLVLWHGVPGTGKTYALRSWARSWRERMEVHYIVDPEVFFGNAALYMVSVLLGGGEAPSVEGETDEQRWRLIVAEDTGELLTKDAKQTTGQSLARLLNVTDGLIGQGLRSLVLITTNEELGTLHDAVTRPGRCLANIGFEDLSTAEVTRWKIAHGVPVTDLQHHQTVAALYAELKESAPIATTSERAVGFRTGAAR